MAADRNRRDFCDLFLDHRAHRDGRPHGRDRGHRLVPHIRGPRVSMERLFLTGSSCTVRKSSCYLHHWALDADHRSVYAGIVNRFPRTASRHDQQDTPMSGSRAALEGELIVPHYDRTGPSSRFRLLASHDDIEPLAPVLRRLLDRAHRRAERYGPSNASAGHSLQFEPCWSRSKATGNASPRARCARKTRRARQTRASQEDFRRTSRP